ncbi:MAG: type transport system permease protein [Thermoleophilaceae bacterium]|nr:type transport system permease protein [Thermoleophilaceae bacterium]
MTELRVVGALARRALAQTFRRPQFLSPIVVFPSLFLAANTGGAGSATRLPGFPHVHGFLDFELAAAMLQSSLLVGVSAGIAIALDIEMGFIDRLMAAPIRRSTFIFGRLAAATVLGMLAGVWFLAVGLIAGAHVQGGVIGAIVVLLLMGLAATAFGGLGAALALGAGKASVVQGIFPLVFVILFLSSAFFPEQLMQEPASTIAGWNPLSLIVSGVRHQIIADASLSAVGTALAGIAVVAVIAAALSSLGLRRRLRAA